MHARPEPSGEEGEEGEPDPFTRHASATLTEEAPSRWLRRHPLATAGCRGPLRRWPLQRLAEAGLEYGPAFQGVEAAWRRRSRYLRRGSLATEQESEAGRYAIHPALLDAAIHPAFLAAEGEQGTRLPFAFAGVSAHATEGPSALRVRLTEAEGRLTIEAADAEGNPVLSVATLSTREVDPAQLGSATRASEALFGIEWAEVELGVAPRSSTSRSTPTRPNCSTRFPPVSPPPSRVGHVSTCTAARPIITSLRRLPRRPSAAMPWS